MYQVGSLQILGLVLAQWGTYTNESQQVGFLEIAENLNVVYGRNGSGKTRALQSVAEVLDRDVEGPAGLTLKLLCRIDVDGLQKRADHPWYDDALMKLALDVLPIFLPFMTPDQIDEMGRRDGLIYEEDWVTINTQMLTLMLDDWEIWSPDEIDCDYRGIAAEFVNDNAFLIRRSMGRLLAEPVLINDEKKLAYRELAEQEEWQLWKNEGERRHYFLNPLPETNYVASGWEFEIPPNRQMEWWLPTKLFEEISVLGPEMVDAHVSTSLYLSKSKNEGEFFRPPDTPDWDKQCDDWATFTAEGELTDQCGAAIVMRDLQDRANYLFGSLLLDAPHLVLERPTLSDGISQNVTWEAQIAAEGELISLDALSAAEKKWATIAINLASRLTREGFLLLDEPEAALHRSSEAHLAKNLQELAMNVGFCVIAASHSPEFLDLPKAETFLFRHPSQRVHGESLVQRMVPSDREELSEFGLLPTDILRRHKGFILVEGQHDLIVWTVLLGEELSARRIEVLPMRGAGKLKSTLDSRVLFDFTDAHLFPVLDALSRDAVSDTWSRALKAKKTEGVQASIEVVLTGLSAFKVDEARLMESFMTRALELNREVRLTPQGLTKPDVLHYLPVAEFVEDAQSWQALIDELERSKGSAPSGNEFKKWLRDAKGADLSDSSIKRAAESCDYIPDDFTLVMSEIDRALEF